MRASVAARCSASINISGVNVKQPTSAIRTHQTASAKVISENAIPMFVKDVVETRINLNYQR